VAGMLCPQCGGHTHRSHTNRLSERIVRSLSSRRLYRCRDCGWRGWLRRRKPTPRRHNLRTVISLLVTLKITTLLALYIVEKLGVPAPDSNQQQTQ
jgi:predicted RNA-binding Zn-ribbon protein involved in translation (DUF1610 family)